MNRIAVVTWILMGLFAAGWALDLNAQKLQRAPLNPAFLLEQTSQDATLGQGQAMRMVAEDGHGLGLRAAPLDLSYLNGRSPSEAVRRVAFPLTNDLRTVPNKLPPVCQQGDHGTCWAFATYASLESCLLPADARDFSENNLANLAGFDWTYEQGGSFQMSIAYLSRWSGPIDESADPYLANDPPNASPLGLPVQKHIQNVRVIPAKANPLDNNGIKAAITDYGAVMVSYFTSNTWYNEANKSYYYPQTNNEANHAVAVVGWDDNFASNKFNVTAPGNGAYIVRNSWGTNWGEQGYFYCSYYDTRMAYEQPACFYAADTTINYGGIYQYDPLGWVNSVGYNTTNAWGANIFTAASGAPLAAVGAYSTDVQTRYEIRVYTGVSPDQPTSGTLRMTQTGTWSWPGYYTVPLNTPVALQPNERFSIVIRFTTSAATFPVAYENALARYSSRAIASPGQSFTSPDGNAWEDMTVSDPTANVCIKGYVGASGSTVLMNPCGAPGDYDGDKVVDPGVYGGDATANQSGAPGTWQVRLSSAGYLKINSISLLGGTGFLAAPGDYDGDKLTDPGVYRQQTGNWQLMFSSGNYVIIPISGFGGPGWLPASADYDGDRKTDPAIYEPPTGNWVIMLSTAGYARIPLSGFLGAAYTLPVSADYDGDKLADPAIYDPVTANWTISLSSANYYAVTLANFLGGTAFRAVPADYDGDKKADPAVYEVGTGAWIMRFSGSGYGAVVVPGLLGGTM